MGLLDLITRRKTSPAPSAGVMAEMAVLREENASLRQGIAQIEKESAADKKTIAKLTAKLVELTAKSKTNSSTSSKPPSTDGLQKPPPKPTNSREQTGRKTGGQAGHKATNLPFKMQLDPGDRVIDHMPVLCSCGKELCDEAAEIAEIRQLHDIPPPPQILVQQHQVHKVKCSGCGTVSRGQFPSEVTGRVCYGPNISASLIYLAAHQYIPLERLADSMHQLFAVKLSEGTIVNKLQVLKKFTFLRRVRCQAGQFKAADTAALATIEWVTR